MHIYIYIYIYILLPAIFDTRNMMARAAAQENFEESRGRGRKGVLMIISQFRFQHVFFRGWNRGNETVIDTHMCVTHTRDAAFLLSIDSKPHHTHTHARTHTHTHRTHSTTVALPRVTFTPSTLLIIDAPLQRRGGGGWQVLLLYQTACCSLHSAASSCSCEQPAADSRCIAPSVKQGLETKLFRL